MPEFGNAPLDEVRASDRTESVDRVPKGAKVDHFSLNKFPENIRTDIRHALRTFPADKQRIPEHTVPFQAVVVAPETDLAEGESADVSYIFTPGITARAKHMTPIVSEVYKATTERNGTSVGFAAALSSSGSVDVNDAPFEKDPLLRAIPQAVIAVELIKNHPSKRIVFLGHSLGSLETPYIAVLVKQMLKDQNIPTEVAGMVLENPGGQYTMSFPETAVGFGHSIIKNMGAIREAFPSWNEVFAAQIALDKAVETEDAGEILHRRVRLDDMKKRLENLTGVPENKQDQVKTIDEQMYTAWQGRDNKSIRSLAKERDELLKGAFEEHMGLTYDQLNEKGNQPSLPRFLNVGRKILHGEGRVNTTHPEWIRNKVDFPVAFLRSENDVLFKPDVTNTRMTLDELARRSTLREAGLTEDEVVEQARFFPQAQIVLNGRVLGTTHIVSGNHPEQYGTMIADLERRMEKVKDTTAATPQKQISLTYSGKV